MRIGTGLKSIGEEEGLRTKESLVRISFVDEKSYENEEKDKDLIISNSRFVLAINQLWRRQQLVTDTNQKYTSAHTKEKGKGLLQKSMLIKF